MAKTVFNLAYWMNFSEFSQGDMVARLHGQCEAVMGERIDLEFDMSRVSYFDPETEVRL